MFVFPGVGLGTIAVGASRVSDDMFLAAATALADCVADELVETGCLFPDIADVGAVSQKVAMAVAQQAIDEGLAEPIEDLSSALEAKTWTPEYLPYKPA
jgi:malate dehydrogenase (oxaloacetate-decarboxylating)